MISVIDMPGPDESIWWRGKRGFEVGFFPCECVEVIGDKVCVFCNCNFCPQVLSNLFERLLLLKKLISLLLQVPHGLNLPHSSATLPHLARFENINQQWCVVCASQHICILLLCLYIFLPGGTQTNPTLQASQLSQFFASTANSSHSSGERQNTKVSNFWILRSFILSRPARGKLKKRGILRERVFGCDLGEHLLNSGNEGGSTHHHTSSKGFACCWSRLSEKRFEVPQRAGMRKRPDLSLRTANQLSAAYRRQKKRWRRSSDRVKIEFNTASRTDVDITKRFS